MPRADDSTCWDKKPNAIDNEGNTSIDDTNLKCSSFSEKMPIKMNFNEDTEIERHKLAIHKPWFSPSFLVNNSISPKDIPVSDSLVFKEFHPVSAQSILNTPNKYDMYHNAGTNQPTQESSTTDFSRESRLRPRIFADKISKWSIF